MPPAARTVQRTYLTLVLLKTLAASFIWGVNTLFLLDAGLSTAEAFAANAFYTLGMVLFEVPTGVVADTRGRRTSFLLGSATLLGSTLIYLLMWQTTAPFWGWAAASALIGLGFTFFSGAVEAWLVDALAATGYTGDIAVVFARGRSVEGVAMLAGSVAGGFLAQAATLGAPYVARAALLLVTMAFAFAAMRDIGFSPRRGETVGTQVRAVLRASLEGGLRLRPVRWAMLTAPFTLGVGLYGFYAIQPHLLQLYGDDTAFGVAGIAAGVFAVAQITSWVLVPFLVRLFRRRTRVLLVTTSLGAAALIGIGLVEHFAGAIAFLVLWALCFATAEPVRQAFLNDQIASEQRATVLSFDALLGSAGGVVVQPAMGRAADVWSYGTSFVISGLVQSAAIPLLLAARRENVAADVAAGPAPV